MPATKAPREKLTLRDAMDLLEGLNRAIEDNIDEIELNDGALPDWMATLLDEIDAATADRVDAIAKKIDEFAGYAVTAKATKDRSARRERVWANAIAGMKAYGLYQVQRAGVDRLRGASSVLRIQRNGQPSTIVALDDLQLLEICDEDARNLLAPAKPGYKAHPLSPFITVTRTAVIDKKALAAAYEARHEELVRESELLAEHDIPAERVARLVGLIDGTPIGTLDTAHPDDIARALADIRRNYVTTQLATEFPGVSVVRGVHLRID